jgi:hypothetical protein
MVGPLSLGGLYGGGMGIGPRANHAPIPEAGDTQTYMAYLADDQQFLHALRNNLATPGGMLTSDPKGYQAVMDAAAANVGNLTPEERAQVIASRTLSMGNRNPDVTADQSVKTIERLANNQGYNGPDAGAVVTTTPAAGGGGYAVTRGEILDNENFDNLVDTVSQAAGGTSPKPGFGAMPGSIINGRSGLPAFLSGTVGSNPVDMTKWSEAERIEFLHKVAQFASDGTLSRDELFALENMANGYSRLGDSEPTAVTANTGFGNPTAISKDDLMENGTFEKLLNSMTSRGLFASLDMEDNNPETKALRDAIATANYDELGYEERVALVQAFNAASGDHTISAQEADGIVKMLQAFQKPSGAGGAASTGTTLSNGLVVSPNDVETPGNFMSMVNSVLDRSGVEMPKTDPSGAGYSSSSDNRYTVPMLRRLDVSELTAGQRTEILEMIAQAGSDREITGDEAKSIVARVNAWSPNGPQQVAMMGGYHFV